MVNAGTRAERAGAPFGFARSHENQIPVQECPLLPYERTHCYCTPILTELTVPLIDATVVSGEQTRITCRECAACGHLENVVCCAVHAAAAGRRARGAFCKLSRVFSFVARLMDRSGPCNSPSARGFVSRRKNTNKEERPVLASGASDSPSICHLHVRCLAALSRVAAHDNLINVLRFVVLEPRRVS